MSEADDDAEILNLADALYAARTALAESNRPPERVGVGELVRFLHGREARLSPVQQRSLFANARLRADY